MTDAELEALVALGEGITPGLVERMRDGEPLGNDFTDAAAALDAVPDLIAALKQRDELREALGAIDQSAFIGTTTDSQEAKQVALESIQDLARQALSNMEGGMMADRVWAMRLQRRSGGLRPEPCFTVSARCAPAAIAGGQ